MLNVLLALLLLVVGVVFWTHYTPSDAALLAHYNRQQQRHTDLLRAHQARTWRYTQRAALAGHFPADLLPVAARLETLNDSLAAHPPEATFHLAFIDLLDQYAAVYDSIWTRPIDRRGTRFADAASWEGRYIFRSFLEQHRLGIHTLTPNQRALQLQLAELTMVQLVLAERSVAVCDFGRRRYGSYWDHDVVRRGDRFQLTAGAYRSLPPLLQRRYTVDGLRLDASVYTLYPTDTGFHRYPVEAYLYDPFTHACDTVRHVFSLRVLPR